MRRLAAWVAFVISAIYAAQGLFLLVIEYDESRFVDRTAIRWEEFSAAYPTVVKDLALKHNERLFAITLLTLALLATVAIHRAIRLDKPAWGLVIWSLPAAMMGMAVVLLLAGISDLGLGTLMSAVVLSSATWLARPILVDTTTR